MRTPEQITASLEARYAQLRAEAERRKRDPEINMPCTTCRWHQVQYMNELCLEPLTKGFGSGHILKSWGSPRPNHLCGREKALWEPRRSIIQRVIDWLLAPWRDADNG
jgi:hypothetical protein